MMQPKPNSNSLPHTVDLVVEDLKQRKAIGVSRYGTALQPCNGRDSLVDAYEESMDLAIYLRNELEERGKFSGALKLILEMCENDCPTWQIAEVAELALKGGDYESFLFSPAE